MVFKIKRKLYVASVSAPLPPIKKFWVRASQMLIKGKIVPVSKYYVRKGQLGAEI
jgi:hypothetical protein